jgi:hypothetical protein
MTAPIPADGILRSAPRPRQPASPSADTVAAGPALHQPSVAVALQEQPPGARATSGPAWLPLALDLRALEPPFHWNKIANWIFLEFGVTTDGRAVRDAVERHQAAAAAAPAGRS